MGGTLLLADDSITIQKVVELTFAETEHTVVAVGSGRELLARLDQVKPDIVLCDVVMPDLNGYEICQRLKSEPATLHLPVVLLTGTFEPFDRDRALAAGCDAIVTKPFEAKELIATVEDLLMRGRATAEAPIEGRAGEPDVFGVPEGVQAIDFTTTGFERMVATPSQPDLAPADGIELTTSSFKSQAGPPVPPPPPELADDSGAALTGRSEEVAVPPAAAGEATEEILTTSPEDQTTPSGPTPSPAERQAAAMALLEAVERRAAVAPEPEAPPEDAFVFAEQPRAAQEPSPEPEVGEEGAPAWLAGTEPSAPVAAKPAARAAEPPAPAAAPITPAVEIALPEPAPRELSQDEVDRIARRVLELAEPLIERIAWEVIPDMAEMLVRQRIRELEEVAEEES